MCDRGCSVNVAVHALPSRNKPASPGGDARPEPHSLSAGGSQDSAPRLPATPRQRPSPGHRQTPEAATEHPQREAGQLPPPSSAGPSTDLPRQAGLGPVEGGPRRASHTSGSPRGHPLRADRTGGGGSGGELTEIPRRRAGPPGGAGERQDAPVT